MGVSRKKVERSGTDGRARTVAGAGPTDLHYGSRGLPAAYRHPGSLVPHEPCPSGPRVTINDTIWESVDAARKKGRHLRRRVSTVDDMEDIVCFCERVCRKGCHLRVPAEESDEEFTSCSSGSKARFYRKRSLPEPSKSDGESAMEMTPSPVRRMFSAPSDSRDIILVTLRMVPAQSQISQPGDCIPPQILNSIMMQNGKRCHEGPQQQESQGIPSSV